MNASAELVTSFIHDLPPALAHLRDVLHCEVIACDDSSRETEHRSLEARLSELLRRYRPKLCIHTGQAPHRARITIERSATNSFMREAIDPARPEGYRSNLPGADELLEVLNAEDIAASYSSNAGQHLCNHILFSSLYFAEKDRLAHRAGFIHIPVLPQQADTYPDAPTMPLEMTRKALSLILNHVVEAQRQARLGPSTQSGRVADI